MVQVGGLCGRCLAGACRRARAYRGLPPPLHAPPCTSPGLGQGPAEHRRKQRRRRHRRHRHCYHRQPTTAAAMLILPLLLAAGALTLLGYALMLGFGHKCCRRFKPAAPIVPAPVPASARPPIVLPPPQVCCALQRVRWVPAARQNSPWPPLHCAQPNCSPSAVPPAHSRDPTQRGTGGGAGQPLALRCSRQRAGRSPVPPQRS